MKDYVSSLENAGFLIDKLARKDYILDGEGRAPLFPCHLSPVQLHEGIKSGKLLQGTFLASRENFLEGSVNCESIEKFVSTILSLSLAYWKRLCNHFIFIDKT